MKTLQKTFLYGTLLLMSFYIGFTLVAPKKTANVLGFKPYVVLSNSMQPTFERGDIVFITKQSPREIVKGDVIAFDTKDHEIVHRVESISIENDQYIYRTKADANEVRDYWKLKENQIYGKLSFTIKYLGHIILFLKSKYGMFSILIVMGLYGIYLIRSRQFEEV